jgi:hypothetical protein
MMLVNVSGIENRPAVSIPQRPKGVNCGQCGTSLAERSLGFTASSGSTLISRTGEEGHQYIGLADVAVMKVVPEPASYLLMIMGLG